MTSGPGAQWRILCQDKALMMVEFMFEKDGVGVPHSHPHVQTTFVSSGQFEFTVGGVNERLKVTRFQRLILTRLLGAKAPRRTALI